jgi:Ca-activated chloride channel family protein
MSGWHVLSVESIHWLWPVLGLLVWWSWRVLQERQLVRTVFASGASSGQSSRYLWLHLSRITLTGLAMIASIVALMQPMSYGQELVTETSIEADVVVALDVSKSMLAEDAPPNRLDRAKYEIMEMVDAMPNYRFSLVGFAGSASILCPLTKDVGFFQMVLNNASPDSISRGGTSIGAALQKGVDAFAGGTSPKLLVVITDGEDHGSGPLDQAETAIALGIPVVTIGFGSEEGSPISLTDPETGAKTQMKDRDGNTVISRLDGELLREIALQTNGAFIPAGVASLDLEGIVKSHITPIVNASSVRQTTTQIPIHGRWIGLGLIMMILAQLVDTPLISGWFRDREVGESV